MVSTKNPKIKYLVDTAIKKSGSDYTSGLSDLGNGKMEQGLINLWKDGEKNGLAKGLVGAMMAWGACVLIQKGIHKYRIKQAITELDEEHELDSDPATPANKELTDEQAEHTNETNKPPIE